jgi:hypothetical protein
MPNVKRLAMIATYVLLGTAACAEEPPTPSIEERLANIERMLEANSQVQPAAYQQMMGQANVPYETVPYETQSWPNESASTQELRDESASLYSESMESLAEKMACENELLYVCRPRSDRWINDIEIIPSILHITDTPFGDHVDNQGTAVRINLGYERADGFGVRFQLWGFGQGDGEFGNVDVGAARLNAEFYRRFFLDSTELALGVGGTTNNLRFTILTDASNDPEFHFSGGGLTIFGEAFHPFLAYKRSDFGLVGRGRVSLLAGEWESINGMTFPETNHDSMMISELAFGVEYRRYFGRELDRYWHIATLAEIQRWDSPWMGEFLASDVSFTGLNINFGVAW